MSGADELRPRRLNPESGAASVVFDCDSTLSGIEGIDELAGPHAEAIAALTNSAMDGTVALEQVYGKRLEIIRPTRNRLEEIGAMYVERMVPDAREVFAALKWLGKEIRIMSGGLRPPVERIGHELGLPPESIAAVGIDFDADGDYSGFERGSPLARSGGKPEVIQQWQLPGPVIMVGDGMTDLETRPYVDLFVAYMGVADRPRVAEAADLVTRDPSLAPILALASGRSDRERLESSPWAETLARGTLLLGAGHRAAG